MKNLNKLFKRNAVQLVIGILAMISGSVCLAQDTIVTRNGRMIIGNVTEVTTTEVKFKKIELVDGPVYTESKSAIEKIKYKNGYTDVFPEISPAQQTDVKTAKKEEEPDYRGKGVVLERLGRKYSYGGKVISENQMHKMLLSLNNPELTRLVRGAKSAKGGQYIGFGAIPAGLLGALLIGLSTSEIYPEQSATRVLGIGLAGTATVLLGTSIIFHIEYKRKNAKAVKLYKKQYE